MHDREVIAHGYLYKQWGGGGVLGSSTPYLKNNGSIVIPDYGYTNYNGELKQIWPVGGIDTTVYDVEIYDQATLEAFRDRVNDGETTLNAIVTASFSMDDTDWTNIGYNTGYSGRFNGNGHTITGLRQTLSTGVGTIYGGLFYSITVNAIVENLTLADLMYTITGTNYMFVGRIVGLCAGTISNCVVSGNIDASQLDSTPTIYIGGIAGTCNAGNITITFINCHNMTNITGNSSSRCFIGGIVGYIPDVNYIIEDCSNSGTLSNGAYIGQIIGYDAATRGPVDSL